MNETRQTGRTAGSGAVLAMATLASTMGCRRVTVSGESDAAPAVAPMMTWGGLTVRTAGDRKHPRQVVVLLHGWGAPGDDLVSLATPLAASGRLFVFPEAPLPNPGGGRAWWHLDMAALQMARMGGRERDLTREIPNGMPEARARIVALLADIERDVRVPRASIVLGGFSQGAMLAVDAALAADPRPGAIVAMSATLVSEDIWAAKLADGKPPIPVFLSHGSGDPVLPFRLAVALRDLVSAAGYPITWIPFEGGHEIPGNVMAGLMKFLERI